MKIERNCEKEMEVRKIEKPMLVSIVHFVPFTARVPSDPYRASVSLSFQFFRSFLELLCLCVR